MTALRQLKISRFRGIAEATWSPHDGLNGLIGAGDSGKSTLLEAIDLVLTQRRNLTFTDADFFGLDVSAPIEIDATLGDLSDGLQDLDIYGQYLRGWDSFSHVIHDEPASDLEVVLTMRLLIDSDLEPHWGLFSERAKADGQHRDLPFSERGRLQPTRLGAFATHHFSWGGRSILNRVSDQRASANLALAEAAREARKTFGDRASAQVEETLKLVRQVAVTAGVRGAADVQALLDAHGVSFSGGAIALHDKGGVPLRNMGVGSSRLLVANLQAMAGRDASICLIDELEHGLEPYRLVRLLHTLGSKDKVPNGQLFLTTHSPICVRELAARQLWKVHRDNAGKVSVVELGKGGDDQATIRACAEAFLAPQVLVCEGATEVGLARGLDLYWSENGGETLAQHGVALADGGGGNFVARALCFAKLGFKTGLWRDSDVKPTADQIRNLDEAGVHQFFWDDPNSTEQQLFASLPNFAIWKMLEIAIDHLGRDAITQQIANFDPALDIDMIEWGAFEATERATLAKAAGKYKWFKTVDQGERVGREVLGPYLEHAREPVPTVIANIRTWIGHKLPRVSHDF